MTADEFRDCMARLGLSILGSHRVFGYSPRQGQRYAKGDTIPAPLVKLIRLMIRHKISPDEVAAIVSRRPSRE